MSFKMCQFCKDCKECPHKSRRRHDVKMKSKWGFLGHVSHNLIDYLKDHRSHKALSFSKYVPPPLVCQN